MPKFHVNAEQRSFKNFYVEAASPEEAEDKVRALEESDPDFWDDWEQADDDLDLFAEVAE